MITYLKNEYYNFNTDRAKGAKLIEIACLSTDTKPTELIVTGSLALEVDTGKIYAFNETASAWAEVA